MSDEQTAFCTSLAFVLHLHPLMTFSETSLSSLLFRPIGQIRGKKIYTSFCIASSAIACRSGFSGRLRDNTNMPIREPNRAYAIRRVETSVEISPLAFPSLIIRRKKSSKSFWLSDTMVRISSSWVASSIAVLVKKHPKCSLSRTASSRLKLFRKRKKLLVSKRKRSKKLLLRKR